MLIRLQLKLCKIWLSTWQFIYTFFFSATNSKHNSCSTWFLLFLSIYWYRLHTRMVAYKNYYIECRIEQVQPRMDEKYVNKIFILNIFYDVVKYERVHLDRFYQENIWRLCVCVCEHVFSTKRSILMIALVCVLSIRSFINYLWFFICIFSLSLSFVWSVLICETNFMIY